MLLLRATPQVGCKYSPTFHFPESSTLGPYARPCIRVAQVYRCVCTAFQSAASNTAGCPDLRDKPQEEKSAVVRWKSGGIRCSRREVSPLPLKTRSLVFASRSTISRNHCSKPPLYHHGGWSKERRGARCSATSVANTHLRCSRDHRTHPKYIN